MLRYKEWIRDKVQKRDTDNDKMKNDRITAEGMQKAERCIISCVQKKTIVEEVSMLKSGQSVKKLSPLYRFDLVILDNLLCIGGASSTHQVVYPYFMINRTNISKT